MECRVKVEASGQEFMGFTRLSSSTRIPYSSAKVVVTPSRSKLTREMSICLEKILSKILAGRLPQGKCIAPQAQVEA
jgi:hypothetical protein